MKPDEIDRIIKDAAVADRHGEGRAAGAPGGVPRRRVRSRTVDDDEATRELRERDTFGRAVANWFVAQWCSFKLVFSWLTDWLR
jgi:hypothetical protein